jgi:hypothetical protein
MSPTKVARGTRTDPGVGSAERGSAGVVFITDFTRLVRNGDRLCATGMPALRWLWHIIRSAPVWTDTGLRCEVLTPWQGDEPSASDFASRKVWSEFIEDAEAEWARRFHHDAHEVFPRWWRRVLAADLVIGFELPPAFRKALQKQGKTYISFYIHPLRFLRDLCLGAVSNDARVVKILEASAVPEQEIAHQVQRFRALCGFTRLAALRVPKDLPIVIGQTARDSILIQEDGSFADWPDYEAELHEHLSGFDACVLLEHPYRGSSRDIAEYLRCRHGKSIISTKTSSYGLLFSLEMPPSVLTLSSSLGLEAAVAGLPVHFLREDPRRLLLLPELETGSLLPLGHGVLSDATWEAILQRTTKTATNPTAQFSWVLGEHYLRDSLDGWDYQSLRNRLRGIQARTLWLPACDVADSRVTELLEQLHPPPRWDGEITLRQGTPPIRLNETRSYTGSDPGFSELLNIGFHPVENWGAWSVPGRSELIIPVESRSGTILEITLHVICFEGVLDQCPVLEVSNEDELLGVAMFRPNALKTAEMNILCRADIGPVRLGFMMSDSASPKDHGSTDNRQLGFGISRIDLHLARGPLKKSSGVAVWGLPTDDGRASHLPMQLLLSQ